MEKSIVVIGAGKIGRGSVALFFSRAGWDVSLYGHSMEKMRDLEAQGYYETRNELGEMDRVEGFRILDCTDDSVLVETLTKGCNLAALALYEGAFPSVGASIGRVIKARVAVGNPEPINFMLCVNAPTALDELEAADCPAVVVEHSVFKSRQMSLAYLADIVIAVLAPLELRIERAVASGFEEEDVRKRIAQQITDAERIEQADVVFNNDGTKEELHDQVVAWWKRYTAKHGIR